MVFVSHLGQSNLLVAVSPSTGHWNIRVDTIHLDWSALCQHTQYIVTGWVLSLLRDMLFLMTNIWQPNNCWNSSITEITYNTEKLRLTKIKLIPSFSINSITPSSPHSFPPPPTFPNAIFLPIYSSNVIQHCCEFLLCCCCCTCKYGDIVVCWT